MHILWLKSDLLLPLDKGGKLRTWHLMRHLARRHEITYLAFSEPETPVGLVAGMREVASRVEVIPRVDPPKGSRRFYFDAAAHLFDPLPYAAGKYRSRGYRARLAQLLEQSRFDVIVCDFLVPAVNLPRTLPCSTVLFTHNVESEIWRRHAETATNPLSRALLTAQYRKMLRFERCTLARFDAVLAVSQADAMTLHHLYPGTVREPICVVPTGVDTEYFTALPGDAASRTIVFTGSMDWLPNVDAMQYFAREILPMIRADEPDVRVVIVGRNPTPAVRALAAADPAIVVTGSVEDVRPFMREAAVYVVPLRIGGGTRLKIFEAMAMAKAVVSTGVGAEGLPVARGEHLMIADEPRAFARDVVRLLRDPDRRRRLETAARALVVEQYDWSAVAGALEDALVRMARTRPVHSPVNESLVPTTVASE